MTGGTVVVLGPVGANFGAGMTGGRAYLYDPTGRQTAALEDRSVRAIRLASALADRPDGQARVIELIRLLDAHRSAGSELAGRLLDEADLAARFWLVEPIAVAPAVAEPASTAGRPTSQPDRNPTVPVSASTPDVAVPSLDATWGSVTPR
jgi:glutamate synthase domain-containing protein 3